MNLPMARKSLPALDRWRTPMTFPACADLSDRIAALVLAATLTTVMGCTDDRRPSGNEATRVDSAGIEIVSNPTPIWVEGEGWVVGPKPDVQIGRQQGAEEEILHEIVAVRRAEDRILVAQATELRFYDHRGEFLQRLGGAGQGPGEFTRLAAALPCSGNRIVAAELTPPRVTVFDGSGEARTVALPSPEAHGQLNTLATLHACTASGVIGGLSGPRLPRSDPPVVQRHAGLVVHLDLADAGLDTLISYNATETYSGLRVPFGRTTLVAATESLLYTADTGEPEVRIVQPDGGTERIVRLAPPDRAVLAEHMDQIRDQYLGGLPPPVLEEVQPLLDAVPIPSTMPYFSRLEVAPDGTLWLQAYQPFRDVEVTRWTVVDSSGVWLGDVELPASFTPHQFGVQDVLGVWRDELGVEYVRVYSIQR